MAKTVHFTRSIGAYTRPYPICSAGYGKGRPPRGQKFTAQLDKVTCKVCRKMLGLVDVNPRKKNPGNRVHSAKFDRCVRDVKRKARGRKKARNAYAVCTATLGRKAFRKRSRNPSRYQLRRPKMYVITARKPGGRLLKLVSGFKFAEHGKAVLFQSETAAWHTAEAFQKEFPVLSRYTVLVTPA